MAIVVVEIDPEFTEVFHQDGDIESAVTIDFSKVHYILCQASYTKPISGKLFAVAASHLLRGHLP